MPIKMKEKGGMNIISHECITVEGLFGLFNTCELKSPFKNKPSKKQLQQGILNGTNSAGNTKRLRLKMLIVSQKSYFQENNHECLTLRSKPKQAN